MGSMFPTMKRYEETLAVLREFYPRLGMFYLLHFGAHDGLITWFEARDLWEYVQERIPEAGQVQ